MVRFTHPTFLFPRETLERVSKNNFLRARYLLHAFFRPFFFFLFCRIVAMRLTSQRPME